MITFGFQFGKMFQFRSESGYFIELLLMFSEIHQKTDRERKYTKSVRPFVQTSQYLVVSFRFQKFHLSHTIHVDLC